MAGVDNEAKPLVASMAVGEETRLSSSEAELVASWAFKIALVADHLRGKPVLGPQIARLFRVSMEVPPDAWIWLGRTRPPGRSIGIFTAASTLSASETQGSTTEQVNIYVCLGQVGSLVFVVVTHGDENRSGWRPAATLLENAQLLRVWPSTGPVNWPPRDSLFFDHLGDLARYGAVSGRRLSDQAAPRVP
jgi:hypothetical protein